MTLVIMCQTTTCQNGEPAFEIFFEKAVLGSSVESVKPFIRVAVRETISHTLILHRTWQAGYMLCDLWAMPEALTKVHPSPAARQRGGKRCLIAPLPTERTR